MLATKHWVTTVMRKQNKPAGVSWFLGNAWQQRLRGSIHGYTVTLPHAISLPTDKNGPQISTWGYKKNYQKIFSYHTHSQVSCIFLLQIDSEAYMYLQELLQNIFFGCWHFYAVTLLKKIPFNSTTYETIRKKALVIDFVSCVWRRFRYCMVSRKLRLQTP